MASVVPFNPHFERSDGEKLGEEITELCSYIYAALLRGGLSYSKARAITGIAYATNEDYLLMVATHGTAHHVERLVTQFRRVQKLQNAEFANELYQKREVTYYYDHDGCLVMKARIPADQGELIVKALEMAMGERYVAEEEPEPVAARRADAGNPHLENGLHVTAGTSVARWHAGEQMDWDHAVSLLSN